ncbi:DUF3150 domain-containing protein [Azospirillum argentinense]|uniref:DUF3150 domain-containing protein n=1 Tax=Azospirillum argentinense TaxID=2970906 RepID=A0A5B0KPR1_9PROT|nr:DUF3150 domain-containing protein [Azospirillum argentinense]KAA1053891.1 Cobalamine biosynthesis protein [Azospirillum argentinense]
MKTLDKVDILSLGVTIWTGRKKLRAEDLNLGVGGELPSEDVASLGSKKVMNPERLNVFHKLKKQMERLLESAGIRFLSGYAIPREKTEAITQALDKIIQEFLEEKKTFLAEYDKEVEEWVAKHPNFEDALRRAIEPASVVGHRLWADYSTFRISPADKSGSLNREVARMGNQLLAEVAQEANELYEKSVASRTEKSLSRRIAGPLKRMRDKLDGLSFLDGAVAPMVAGIDELIASFPEKGHIEDGVYHEVVAKILILSDPDKIRSYAASRPATRGIGDLFASMEDGDIGDPDDDFPDEEDEDEPEAVVQVTAAPVEETKAEGPTDFSIFDGLFGEGSDAASPDDADAAAEEPSSEAAAPVETEEAVQADAVDKADPTATVEAETVADENGPVAKPELVQPEAAEASDKDDTVAAPEQPADTEAQPDADEASGEATVDDADDTFEADEEDDSGDLPDMIPPQAAPVEAVESYFF